MSNKIMIVDDNPEIREVINVLLTSEGYEIIEAADGKEALAKITNDIDLLILDVMMPNMNGYQLCVKLREITNAPVLFLTAKSQESDKTLGFSSGGDDYLTKPFSYNELNARVKALLRRYQIYQGKGSSPGEQEATVNPEISYKSLLINEFTRTLKKDGVEVILTDIEFEIILYLIKHPHTVIPPSTLFERIWQEEYYYGANNTIMVHIRNLRKKIEENPNDPKIIKTIWGKGYYCD